MLLGPAGLMVGDPEAHRVGGEEPEDAVNVVVDQRPLVLGEHGGHLVDHIGPVAFHDELPRRGPGAGGAGPPYELDQAAAGSAALSTFATGTPPYGASVYSLPSKDGGSPSSGTRGAGLVRANS